MAKKKKKSTIPRSMRKKFRELKHNREVIAESTQRLVGRIQSIHPDMKFDSTAKKPEKMSEILISFAEPLLENAHTYADYENAISIAIVAWNLSLLPSEALDDTVNALENVLSASGNAEINSENMFQVVDHLKKRKQQLFPDIYRMIVDYELIDTDQGFHLNVISNAADEKMQI